MESDLLTRIASWSLPLFATVALTASIYWVLSKTLSNQPNNRVYRQLSFVALVVVANIVLVLALPFENETQQQLLSLFGLVITAVIALSSTTFVSNAMAGITLPGRTLFENIQEVPPGHYVRFSSRGISATSCRFAFGSTTRVMP